MQLTFYPTILQSTCFAGCRQSSSKNGFTINSGKNSTLQYGAFGSSGNITLGAHSVEKHVVSIKNGLFVYDDVEKVVESSTLSTNYSVYLFGCNSGELTLPSSCRIYSCQLWESEELKRDLVPCFNAKGEAGMWDKIENKFYGNIGEDKFITPYEKVEYIESTGTQYINTGFIPNNNTRVVLDFSMTKQNASSQIFGSRYNTSSRVFAFNINAENTWRFGYGDTYYSAGESDTFRHILDFKKNIVMLDGKVVGIAAESEFFGYTSLCIGAVKASAGMYYGHARFYSCKIYDNDILIRDFVPCVNIDGQIGMIDKLENKFYGNSGKDEFIICE